MSGLELLGNSLWGYIKGDCLGKPMAGEVSTSVLILTSLTIPTAQPSWDQLPGTPEEAKGMTSITRTVSWLELSKMISPSLDPSLSHLFILPTPYFIYNKECYIPFLFCGNSKGRKEKRSSVPLNRNDFDLLMLFWQLHPSFSPSIPPLFILPTLKKSCAHPHKPWNWPHLL